MATLPSKLQSAKTEAAIAMVNGEMTLQLLENTLYMSLANRPEVTPEQADEVSQKMTAIRKKCGL